MNMLSNVTENFSFMTCDLVDEIITGTYLKNFPDYQLRFTYPHTVQIISYAIIINPVSSHVRHFTAWFYRCIHLYK